jgi:hypothetical protein
MALIIGLQAVPPISLPGLHIADSEQRFSAPG